MSDCQRFSVSAYAAQRSVWPGGALVVRRQGPRRFQCRIECAPIWFSGVWIKLTRLQSLVSVCECVVLARVLLLHRHSLRAVLLSVRWFSHRKCCVCGSEEKAHHRPSWPDSAAASALPHTHTYQIGYTHWLLSRKLILSSPQLVSALSVTQLHVCLNLKQILFVWATARIKMKRKFFTCAMSDTNVWEEAWSCKSRCVQTALTDLCSS